MRRGSRKRRAGRRRPKPLPGPGVRVRRDGLRSPSVPRFGGRGRALEGREHDGLTAERALAVGALPPEEGPAGQPAAPGAAGGGAQVSGAAGKGMGIVSPAGLSPASATGNGRAAGGGDVHAFGFLGRVSEEVFSAL